MLLTIYSIFFVFVLMIKGRIRQVLRRVERQNNPKLDRKWKHNMNTKHIDKQLSITKSFAKRKERKEYTNL